MATKDSYWFRHDSTSGRGLRIRKMQHIYGHEGKGLYWDVVEVLREQEGYVYESDESSLHLLSDLIGFKDFERFVKWFNDCVRLGLFLLENAKFQCPVLSENMKIWEKQKANGSKSSGNKQPKHTQSIPKVKPKHNIRGDNREKRRGEEEGPPSYSISDLKNIDELKTICLADEKWIADCAIDLTIEKTEVINFLNKFNDKLNTDRDFAKTEKDYSSHFKNWVRLQAGKKTGDSEFETKKRNGDLPTQRMVY